MMEPRHSVRSGPGKFLLMTALCLLALTPAEAQWLKSVQFDNSDMAQDLAEALTFQKYPTYDQYVQMMQGFAAAYPQICLLDTIGYSVEGRMLLALKISDQVEEDEAEADFFYTSTMHGNEIVGFVLLLRLADMLLKGYGLDNEITTLVDNLQIWINPLANPDGSYSGNDGTSLEYAKRVNIHGTDLNRDFPSPYYGEADDTTGREPETRYMMVFLREHEFTMSANIHSGAEVVNYPWDSWSYQHMDSTWYRFISHEYADEAMAVDPDYMWGWPEGGITNGFGWYQALGTRQDYIVYYLGGHEVTLELYNDFLLPSSELENHWNINQRSLLNYMSQCLYGIRGTVTDQETGHPVRARLFVQDRDSAFSAIHSSAGHGDFYRLIEEGVYDLVFSAPGHLNDTAFDVEVTNYQATLLNIQLKSNGLQVTPPEAPAFRLYPNPAVYHVMVEPLNMAKGKLELSVVAIDGRRMIHRILDYHGSGFAVSTAQLEPGIYLVRCTQGTRSEVQRLMVIRR
jgi:hypothetical protein